jgi:hypothetical protein
MVWVRAIALGYHNGLREIGDEFEIPDDFPNESPWWCLAPGRNAEPGSPIEPRRGPGRPRLTQED